MNEAVIVIGGYNSIWPAYLKLARCLEDFGRRPVVAVPLLPWHWWAATRDKDATHILHRLAETISWARRRLHASSFALVGHSAGGLVARLYLSEEPVWGHTYTGVDHISSIVTLGSPHCGNRLPDPNTDLAGNWFLVNEANRLVPGATHGGRVRYLAVAGRFVLSKEDGTYSERRAHRYYSIMNGQDGSEWGDGIVPVRCAQLEGAGKLVLDGVSHSTRFGRPWYGGSRQVIQRWWRPEASGVG